MGRIWTRPRTPIAAELLRPDIKPSHGAIGIPRHGMWRDFSGAFDFMERSGSLIFNSMSPRGEVGVQSGMLREFDYLRCDTYAAGVTDTVTLTENASTLLGTTECTLILGYRKTDTTKRYNLPFCLTVEPTTAYRCQCHIGWNDANATVYWDWGGTSDGTSRESYNWAANGGPDSVYHVWAFTVGPRGMEIWQDGRIVASHGGSATRTVSTDAFGFGTRDQGSDLAEYHNFKVFKKQIPKGDIEAISRAEYLHLRPANDAPFRYTEAIPPATGEDNAILMASNF